MMTGTSRLAAKTVRRMRIGAMALLILSIWIPTETLSADEPQPIRLKGVVCPAKSGSLSFQNKGRVVSVLGTGSFVRSLVWNPEKKVLSRGDVIARQDSTLYQDAVNAAAGNVDLAASTLKEKKMEYDRCLKLIKTHSISEKDFDLARMTYMNAKIELENQKGALATARYNLEVCELRAPYCGIIEEIYVTPGALVWEGDPVLKLTMMDPVTIRVAVGDFLAGVLTSSDPISIFPLDSSAMVGGRWRQSVRHDDVIDVITRNHLIPSRSSNAKTKEGQRVDSLSCAIRLQPMQVESSGVDGPLCVPNDSIVKEGEEHVVWKGKGARFYQPGKGVPESFEIEKVVVKPTGDRFAQFPEGIEFQVIEPTPSLREYDVILSSPPSGLKSGMTVSHQRRRWLFRPGDVVDVVIYASAPISKKDLASILRLNASLTRHMGTDDSHWSLRNQVRNSLLSEKYSHSDIVETINYLEDEKRREEH